MMDGGSTEKIRAMGVLSMIIAPLFIEQLLT